ncbi:hypothetical protein F5Y18DRAFT_373876 [Xylariaceae sp. FL1019]|nr:hypothetical protein F5Y18DRAFT_373876 [Xylariaceae sp. FL1019]
MAEMMDIICQRTANMHTGLKITDLPCEIIVGVLRALDDIRDLPNALLSCRYFYTSYKECPTLAFDILISKIDSALMPYCVAVHEASCLPKSRSRSSVKQLLDTLYDDPSALSGKLRHMELSAVLQMSKLHRIIGTLVWAFAYKAWNKFCDLAPVSPCSYTDLFNHIAKVNFPGLDDDDEYDQIENRRLPDDLSLTSSEVFRFNRAFYRVALFFYLFCGQEGESFNQIDVFFSRHSPWVSEQLWCIRHYLKNRRGEKTVEEMFKSSSHQVRKLLRPFIIKYSDDRFEDGLEQAAEPQWKTVWDTMTLESSDEDFKALEPKMDTEDTDSGPLRIWKSASTADSTPPPFQCFKWNDLNREAAYVFWDLARVEKYEMEIIFAAGFDVGVI